MRARTAVTAAALAAASALILTACGGGSGGDDKITSSPSTAASSASPSASPSPAGGASLKIDPALSLPADLKMQFDFKLPANHSESLALTTSADFMQAMNHAVVKQSTKDPSLAVYSAGDALAFGKSYVQQYVTHGWTLTGTDLFYTPKVTLSTGKSAAQVTFCENQGKVYGKVIKTGKVLTTPEDDNSYVSYTVSVARLPTPTEVWQAQSITVKEKALQCKQ